MDGEPQLHLLAYRSARRNRLNKSGDAHALFIALDIVVSLLLLSQLTFLLAMMAINIRECGVPPYGFGSSYKPSALGNAEFVQALPAISAQVAKLDQYTLRPFAMPAFFINYFTNTYASWAMAAYLIWRSFRTRGVRRFVTAFLAFSMCATLPWIWEALMVAFD